MHLDRDDRGEVSDIIEVEGRRIVHPVNQEIVSLRGVAAGEYIVNLYLYHASGEGPVPVTVKLERVNPRFETVLVEQVELTAQDEEVTVARFTLGNDREVGGINRLAKRLTPYAL
jgi:endonuclease III